ncbi:DUF4192 family protein [Demequina capsici]|uniref:DUF4192 family protein n=1 Tax=Demequina capsici TaxID=3075620 RepID=A0AA96JEH6_9MICO|nr:DUF4192 family protein [Demequina sp. OYTSA14]WNM25694.1 DUF4192 family protein [Demequina sp. OYTSA14]
MKPTIRVSEPAELIALVPRLLGFEPRDSIVVLGVDQADRVTMMARLDREDCLLPDVATALACAIASEVDRTRSCALVVLEYAEHPVPWGTEASEGLCLALRDSVVIRDTWVIHAGRYWAPGCDDPLCCPPGGRPVDVREGACGDEVAREPERDRPLSERRRSARRARARFLARRARDEGAWRDVALDEWTRAMRGTRPSASTAGRLGAALGVPAVRDAVIVTAFGGSSEQVHAVLHERIDSDASRCLDEVMHGSRRPVGDVARALDDALADVQELVREHERAAALAVRALLAWWQGDAEKCLVTARFALAADPASRLAALVQETAWRGIRPGWLRATG